MLHVISICAFCLETSTAGTTEETLPFSIKFQANLMQDVKNFLTLIAGEFVLEIRRWVHFAYGLLAYVSFCLRYRQNDT
jgi:hypothetical protein